MSNGQPFNRPLLQRRELGPMLHDLGHRIYDEAEVHVVEYGIGPTPSDLGRLALFAEAALSITGGIVQAVQGDRANAPVDALIKENHYELAQHLTHSGSLAGVLQEGIGSGVISPLQLYRTVKLFEMQYANLQHDLPTLHRPEIDAREAIERIESPEFQHMLHVLARGHNGSLGTSANTARSFRSDFFGSEHNPHTFKGLVDFGLLSSFVVNKAGQVTGLTDKFLGYQKAQKHYERNTFSGNGLSDSGGCPVRYAEFPVVGDHAQDYLRGIGVESGQPRYQGESLITRASRFVVVALRTSLEQTS